ncbi:hypothetical protein ACQZ4Q_14665 [Agrobacterium vitis]
MKLPIIIIGTLLIASSAVAKEGQKIDSSLCPMLGGIAKTIMERRQQNVPMSELIEAIDKGLGQNDAVGGFAKTIVIQAYDAPGYVTEESKKQEVLRFSNAVMQVCYKGTL